MQDHEDEVLARIGPRTITAREFLERIDLTPWQGKDNPATRDSVKMQAIASLVAEKLMSLQAAEQGFLYNQQTLPELRALERLLARDELYRREISMRVSVDSADVRRGLERYAWRLKLNSFVMDSERAARRLAAALNAQRTVAGTSMSLDGVVSHDTIAVGFGDLLESYEAEVYSIHIMREARVVFTPEDGWAVLQLLEKSSNEAYEKASTEERRAAVRRIVQKRQETIHAGRFLRTIFDTRVVMDSSAFHVVAETLRTILIRDSSSRRQGDFYALSDEDVRRVRMSLAAILNRKFITMGDYSLTVGDVVEEFAYFPLRFGSLRRAPFLQSLNRALQPIGEAGVLSNIAMKNGLHQHHEVRRQLEMWVEATQAERLVKHLLDSLGRSAGESTDGAGGAGPTLGQLETRVTDAVNRYVARLATAYRVEIDFDKAHEIRISPTNVVTRRYIGFGGSMLGVPMLLRLWEWMEVWRSPVPIPP